MENIFNKKDDDFMIAHFIYQGGKATIITEPSENNQYSNKVVIYKIDGQYEIHYYIEGTAYGIKRCFTFNTLTHFINCILK